jgi:hypothetical protein
MFAQTFFFRAGVSEAIVVDVRLFVGRCEGVCTVVVLSGGRGAHVPGWVGCST